jgi:uncharacterized protein (TIGR03437 family)
MPQSTHYKLISLAFVLASISQAAAPDRITRQVNASQSRALTGNTQPQAEARFDRGAVDPGMPMNYVVLIVRPSQAQQAELDRLLVDQQNPGSPSYHQWLSPEVFGNRFGLSPSDHSKIVAWLHSEGLTVNVSGRGRNWVAFSGTAGQISKTLRTPIHRFEVGGELHYANTVEPSVPEALSEVVGGFLGLNDFHLQPMIRKVTPEYNSGGSHYLAPPDWATVYNVAPLYQAGIDGTGQSIVVVGESDVPIADIRAFRTRFGLPANDPKMLLYGGTDPGFNDAQIEGDLDLEWAGAIAPKATIYYVFGSNAITAITAAVSANLSPVITVSYGSCEIGWRLSYWRAIAQQANAQGITILNSSGDSGAAGCDAQGSLPMAAAGRSVDFPAVLPEVTGVGGTQLAEGTGSYWATTNGTNLTSALSYIPEVAWNDTDATGLLASGGGASLLYARPAWQTGPGVPNDNARHVPDVAMSAAAHDAYTVTYNSANYFVNGTSASSPSFAGVIALLNQYQVSKGYQASPGMGNINPQLYRLAQDVPAVFHDVTSGNNVVPCSQGSPDCGTGSYGYQAAAGYDMATGLGSVDANSLVTQWHTDAKGVTTSLFLNASRVTVNDTIGMTASVFSAASQGDTSTLPTGTVSFSANGVALGTSPLHTVGGIQEADLFFPAYQLGVTGTVTIVAEYSGDTAFGPGGVTKSVVITIPIGASAIIPTAPDTVWPAAPDAQGLAWSAPLALREVAGVASLLTGFTIDGIAQPLGQYFPAPQIAPLTTISTTVVLRNLDTPATRTFGFTGVDVNGNSWSRQIAVSYLASPPGNFPVLTATPLVVAQNPAADPSCQWAVQLNADETGGNGNLEEASLVVGGVDWTKAIPGLFGTLRLAPWAGLQGQICLGGIVPPATQMITLTTTSGGQPYSQNVTVSLTGPAANPAKLSASPATVTIPSSQTPAGATLGVQLDDPKASWTASIFPANRTTSWLGLSSYSGTGSASLTLTASPAGFEPGVYRANLVIQSPTAVPQTVTVPILYVWGPTTADSAITAVLNSANYSSAVSPGMVVGVFGTDLASTIASASSNPLPATLGGVSATVNGISAPLAYVSPTQINLQIPYEAGAGPSVIGINNNGNITGYQFQISAAAPGILSDADGNVLPTAVMTTGTGTILVAGAGEVTNFLPTGAASPSASLYKPVLPLSVTVGGVPAFIQSVGEAVGLVGMTSVRFTLPSTVAAGVQPVVVTVNGVASQPANITVQ